MPVVVGPPLSSEPLPAGSPPAAPESDLFPPPQRASPLLDAQGLLEAAGGTVIALIALVSSYGHITLPGRVLLLQQQWGDWLIAASLALVVG